MNREDRNAAIIARYQTGESSMRNIAHTFGVSVATVHRAVRETLPPVAVDSSTPKGKRIASQARRRKITDQLHAREKSIAILEMVLATCRAGIAQVEKSDPRAQPVLDDLDHIATDIAEHIETLWDSTVTILDGNGMAL